MVEMTLCTQKGYEMRAWMSGVVLSVMLSMGTVGMVHAQARPAVFGLQCIGQASGMVEGTVLLEHAAVPVWNVCYEGTALQDWPAIPDNAGAVRGLHLSLTSYHVGTATPPGRCLASTTQGWLSLRCAVTPEHIEAVEVLVAVP